MMHQPLNYDVVFGRMDTPQEEERTKKLYKQLERIQRDWEYISPAPQFKIIKDRAGQVHIKFNERMLMHLLAGYSDIAEEVLGEVEPEDPPEWFMKLMGGEPYVRPDDGGGI